ncbi:Hypothetical predicted protein [Octopus vulgaris]|uniref:Uncharacterized protein n=1 Tax=Octopus vulgaris TaxID=6645 RepID=A0AA36FDW1_OCTVU|nr:Hypothetical predicted protein [Octopus vulgaris]
MGIQNSKKKKEKKWKKYTDIGPSPGLTYDGLQTPWHHLQGMKGLPTRSIVNSPKYYYSDFNVAMNTPNTMPPMNTKCSAPPSVYRGGAGSWPPSLGELSSDNYLKINLDNHPDVTKLQNEQNARRENMEQRINKIRTSAIQAAERRKFAEMFKAVPKETQTSACTSHLLQETSLALSNLSTNPSPNPVRSINSNNSSNKSARGSGCRIFSSRSKISAASHHMDNDDDDKGEIIPVQILSEGQKPPLNKDQITFGSLRFNDPMMYLLLPVLLPMFIIVCIIRGLGHTGAGSMWSTIGGPGCNSTDPDSPTQSSSLPSPSSSSLFGDRSLPGSSSSCSSQDASCDNTPKLRKKR